MGCSGSCSRVESSDNTKQKGKLLGKRAIIVIRIYTIFTFLVAFCFAMPLELKAGTIFQSNFEGDVSLSTPRVIDGDWWQEISYNPSAGRLPGGDVEMVMFKIERDVVKTLSDLNTYIKSEIQTVKNARGNPTRAWLMHNIKHFHSGPPYYTGQRISLNVNSGNTAPDDLKELYIKYDMKFIPAFGSSMTGDAWYLLWENSVIGNSNKLHIYRSNDNRLLWKLEPHTDKPYYNSSIPVPLNEWFEISIYYKHSLQNDGKITIRINGKTLFDYTGSTADFGGVGATNLLKSYSNIANVGHWVDNLVIADGLLGSEVNNIENPTDLRVTGSSP